MTDAAALPAPPRREPFTMALAERGLVPDALIRHGIRRLCAARLDAERAGGEEARYERFRARLDALRASPIAIHTDAAILGKLGQFGQAVMKKKADQVVSEFAQNMSRRLGEEAAAGWPDAGLEPDPEAVATDPAVAEGGRTSPDEIEVPEKVS